MDIETVVKFKVGNKEYSTLAEAKDAIEVETIYISLSNLQKNQKSTMI